MKEDIFELFGIPFSTLSQRGNLDKIISLSKSNFGASVLFTNAHVTVEAQRKPDLLRDVRRATLVVPDGVPIAWVLHAKRQSRTERYSGPDLMEDVFDVAPQSRHLFLGSTPMALEKIKKKFKGNAVGFYSPPFCKDFSEEEKLVHLKMVEELKPDFIWIGLGAPKQEHYVVEMSQRSKRGVWLAVGAAFEFYAGLKPRAPKFLQKMGLEWAFRMATEPRRLAKRYISTNPVFIKLALQEIFKS